MAYDENIYAKIISGEITKSEIDHLKSTGEWQEIQSILEATEELELKPHDKKAGFEALLKKRDGQNQTQSQAQHQTQPETPKKGAISWLIPIVSAAAAVALLVGFFFFSNNVSTKVSAQYSQTVEVSPNKNVSISLNDGSTIEYNEGNNEKAKLVQLEGEAYFNVVPGNPLIVQTKNGKIEVLGTKFNVRAWGNQLSVECFEGRVKVSSKNSNTELQKMEAVTTTNGKLNQKSNINYTSPTWLNGTTRIKQEPLSEVLKELERQYNVKIKAPTLNRVFSGEFSHSNLEKALDDVCKPMGLTYKIIQPDLIEIYE